MLSGGDERDGDVARKTNKGDGKESNAKEGNIKKDWN